MRFLPFALLGLLLTILGSPAQVTVELLLDQEQFLRDESLPVKVRITNRSGQTLQLGKEADWLTFTVENRDGRSVRMYDNVPVVEEWSLESAMVGDRKVDLMPYFDLSIPGRYRVTATVKIRQWNDEVVSKAKDFDIIRGSKIWEQEFGVPAKEGPPEARKYALQQAMHIKQLWLYGRITDLPENRVFRVVQLGPMVSFGRPDSQIDRESNLHVLFQTGARSFNYRVLNPDGEILTVQSHDYTATRPILRAEKDGKIIVAGGQRRFTPKDWPPVPETNLVSQATNTLSLTNVTAATNQAPATNDVKKSKKGKSKKANTQ